MSINHLTAAELGALFTRVAPECFQDWDFMYIFTHATALPVFQYACKHWLNDPQLSVGYKLFAGSDQLPEARVGRVLWNLAKLAGDDPVIRQTIGTEEPWSAIEPRLRATPNGVQFLAQWNDFMIQHGHHAYGELELANARWAERPDYVLGILRNLLANPNHPDLGESQRQRYLESKRLEEECCLRLRNPFKRFVFLLSLRRARRLSALREEWKDQAVKLLAHFRRMLLRLGELLVNRGVLESADDVFFLEYSQIQPVSSGDSGFDAKTLVAQRRKEFLANQQLNPPPIVFGTFKGEAQSLPARNEAGTCLKGIPTSPGIVKGRARVMMRSDTLEPFAAGEILVAPFTDPSWTPYFVSAAAVVTDSGGILSHGSIVAREYGIPAVISVFDATRLIQTGDWLEVDGYRGVVTKLTRGIVTG